MYLREYLNTHLLLNPLLTLSRIRFLTAEPFLKMCPCPSKDSPQFMGTIVKENINYYTHAAIYYVVTMAHRWRLFFWE